MSIHSRWRYTINTFEVNTVGSNIKMLSLSADTYTIVGVTTNKPDAPYFFLLV